MGERRLARGEQGTMLIARPTTLSGVFDALDKRTSAHLLAGGADHLLPTPLDMPAVEQKWIELSELGSPYGANGKGEPDGIALSAEPAASTG